MRLCSLFASLHLETEHEIKRRGTANCFNLYNIPRAKKLKDSLAKTNAVKSITGIREISRFVV